MANRLADETSPYLLQHAHNPVDWYPWGPEALERARKEDKPIFLSIGYSACHWCHVMERESFESEETAAILNREFVSIKVDREERPDIDSIYMQAVQMLTGHGGWPMSMFLNPEGVPFYGGTYFPPEARHGLPSFQTILTHIADAYKTKKDDIARAASEIRASLSTASQTPSAPVTLTHDDLERAAMKMIGSFDATYGGFGGAPKFPPSMSLDFLMQVAHRTGDEHLRHVITFTLRKMANGGIYDQIGGGFHRYSVDQRWLAPHFEKMLYDNALLARLYLRAWQWSKDPFFARITREVLGFVQREMTSPDGGFYSTLDADSEGVEGKFYVWQRAEIMEILGDEEGKAFCALFDISEHGNWEETNIPNVPKDPAEVAAALGVSADQLSDLVNRAKCKLYGVRAKRIWPGRDEKILAGWNGWMLTAFSDAAIAFDSADYRETVTKNADFLMASMSDGRKLFRSWKDGRARIAAVLEDYTGVAWGLIAAFEATQQRRYLDRARELAEEIITRFADEKGGFFDTAIDHEILITRPKDLFDNATPSGNSIAVDVLLRLALYFGDESLHREAVRALGSSGFLAHRHPSAFGFLLGSAEWILGSPKEIAITGPDKSKEFNTLMRVVGDEFVPHRILVWRGNSDLPLMEGRVEGDTAAYVCSGYVCQAPTKDPETLRALLTSSATAKP
ncbi:MAG TPA: thioredoxin domain-containing protein [Thermoanaerobaculia bacterium]|nr:thioredoxin domain-containing protein [Thermoanaerobaculia bacterium]